MSVPRDADERLQRLSDRIEELGDRLKERPVVSVLVEVAFSVVIAAAFPRLAGGRRWGWRVTSGREIVWRVLTAVALQAAALWLKERAEAYGRRLDDFVRRHGRDLTEEEARRLWSRTAP